MIYHPWMFAIGIFMLSKGTLQAKTDANLNQKIGTVLFNVLNQAIGVSLLALSFNIHVPW